MNLITRCMRIILKEIPRNHRHEISHNLLKSHLSPLTMVFSLLFWKQNAQTIKVLNSSFAGWELSHNLCFLFLRCIVVSLLMTQIFTMSTLLWVFIWIIYGHKRVLWFTAFFILFSYFIRQKFDRRVNFLRFHEYSFG